MDDLRNRILLVEQDPDIVELISRQILAPLGFQINVVDRATTALHDFSQLSPDVIITNLNLSDLSGKDLLIAFSSQGIDVPIIVIGGNEIVEDVVQVFRLGASDYLIPPLRETEVIFTVEKALKKVQERLKREQLTRQIEKMEQMLKQRTEDRARLKSVVNIVDDLVASSESAVGYLDVFMGKDYDQLNPNQKEIINQLQIEINQITRTSLLITRLLDIN
jgi:DNA-binding NtrC family response regulator